MRLGRALGPRGVPGSLNSKADGSSGVPRGRVRQPALVLDGAEGTIHCSRKQASAARRSVLPPCDAKGQLSSGV